MLNICDLLSDSLPPHNIGKSKRSRLRMNPIKKYIIIVVILPCKNRNVIINRDLTD